MCFTRTNLVDLVIQRKNVEKYHEILAYVFPFLRLKRARTNEISVIIGIYSTNTKIIIQNTSIDFSPYFAFPLNHLKFTYFLN